VNPSSRGDYFLSEREALMYTLAIIVEVVVSILLMIAVLMQSSKGGGLAGSLGGANIGTVFGVRRTSDFLTTMTQWLAVIFLVLALVTNLWFLPRGGTARESVIQAAPSPTSLPPSQPVQTNPLPTGK
jgi:preprotein translocase subunit SecG